MRLPSIKTLSAICDNPKEIRKIFEMSRAQLLQTEAGAARAAECYGPIGTAYLRMYVLNAEIDGTHGVECMATGCDEWATYLNTGDSYAPTIIYWRGNYRVQSIGDFVEIQERNGVAFT